VIIATYFRGDKISRIAKNINFYGQIFEDKDRLVVSQLQSAIDSNISGKFSRINIFEVA